MVFPVVFLEISFYIIQAAVLKGQTKPKADCCTVNSPNKEQTNLFCLLFLLFTANKQICLFGFWDNLRSAQTAFGFIRPLHAVSDYKKRSYKKRYSEI